MSAPKEVGGGGGQGRGWVGKGVDPKEVGGGGGGQGRTGRADVDSGDLWRKKYHA